ncbi:MULTISPECIES: peptidylprolyl isomerase [Rufibacter]|uniref:Peptidyl-prolyl cis-trans isomerase SurA n=1 Tax=Rufibacter quisquiliarum TaxID=1549639 RepID=A0A839GJ90_9BACT|nr:MULTISPECIES: peptidylprolyl isomerase [Rufibacter]MBA9079684.1 peptidyl-prolyl cis-trans isomerase SurA [Rufibacter quisquiliarum]
MRLSSFYVGLGALLLFQCGSPKKATEPVVLSIGSETVPAAEFAYVYEKNNGNADSAYSSASIKEYLDLYTNYKLKVAEAKSRGLDTTEAFKKELGGYKEQLAQPYLTEKSVTDQLVREAYERMKKEINATHLLVTVEQDADPKDTLAAYEKIMGLRQQAVSGTSFEALARQHSEDPSAKENSGNLGYFTALQMVYPFENAAYTTSPGQISQPVRTRFGYHLIKVNEVRPAQGEIKVAHIMVRAQQGLPKADSLVAKNKIDEIYKRVQRQENWDKLSSQFSEDAASADNGGELPWFGTGRMIPSFEEAAFALAQPGAITPPVQTPYGWHIIKLLERKELPTYEEMETSLRNRISKDSRSELNKAAFLRRIRKENNLQEVPATKEAALKLADSTLVVGNWQFQAPAEPKNFASATLFTIGGQAYTVTQFADYVEANQRPKQNVSPAHAMNLLYDRFVETSLLNYEREHLEEKHQDFRMLVKDYHDGILLFQLMEEKVWAKAVEDTVGLKAFFEQNRDKYTWGTRAKATILSAASPAVLAEAQKQLQQGKFPSVRFKQPDLTFEFGNDNLLKNATTQLDQLVTALQADTSLSVQLTGYTDARETTNRANRTLATRRAAAVKNYLQQKGVQEDQVEIVAAADRSTSGRNARRVSVAVYSSDLQTLADQLNQNNPLALQVTARKFQRGENKALDAVNWQPGTYTVEQDGRTIWLKIDQVEPPMPKQLNETRGLVISDYQNYLEKEWIKELRQKYPVNVNQEQVQKLIRKESK